MELSDLRKTISSMSDEELLASLKEVRTNRRTSSQPKPKAEPSASAKAKKTQSSSMSLDALLASAKANPAIAAQLLAALQGGKK